MSLQIEISDKCTGHGRCYMLAPQLFEPDDEGYSVVLRSNVESATDLEAARAAAAACPESAILLNEI